MKKEDIETSQELSIFSRTRYSLAEEDRVVNALMVVLRRLPAGPVSTFLNQLSVSTGPEEIPEFYDHLVVGPDSIVDLVFTVPRKLLGYLEAKIVPNQFDDPEQSLRYWDILKRSGEPRRFFLLVSPDRKAPAVVETMQSSLNDPHASWVSWNSVVASLNALEGLTDPVTSFLRDEFSKYMDELGLRDQDSETDANSQPDPQLRLLLSNVATEKILLHLYQHGRGTVSEIKRNHSLGSGETQRALARLVKGGFLAKRRQGNLVLYQYNQDSPFLPAILALVRTAYSRLSQTEKQTSLFPRYKP